MATLKYELTYAAGITIEDGCAIDTATICITADQIASGFKNTRVIEILPGPFVQVIVYASGTKAGLIWSLKYWINDKDQTPDGPIVKKAAANGHASYNYRRKLIL